MAGEKHESKQHLAEKVDELRAANEALRIVEACEKAGVSPGTYYKWKREHTPTKRKRAPKHAPVLPTHAATLHVLEPTRGSLVPEGYAAVVLLPVSQLAKLLGCGQ